MRSKIMSAETAQAVQTPESTLKHEIYGAFMDVTEKQGGVKEPVSNPWPSHVPFYQILDELAAVAAEIALREAK
jgi:hypothetical protein